MRVALVRDEPDARTFKLRSALVDAGQDAHEFVRFGAYHRFHDRYTSPERTAPYRFYYDGSPYEFLLRHLEIPNLLSYGRLARRLRSAGFDLLHSNSVTEHLAVGLTRHGKTPVVTEVYDSTSLYEVNNLREAFAQGGRSPGRVRALLLERIVRNALRWERVSHEEGAGLVYTSEEMLEYARRRYDITCPSAVVPNAVYGRLLLRDAPPDKLSDRDSLLHIVYVGGIRDSSRGNHRDICDQLNQLAHGDVMVHLYPLIPPQEVARVHTKLDGNPSIRWHTPVPYSRLYVELSRYDAGLVLLAPHNVELLNVALPNKIFEYVACGLPVFVSPYKPLIDFVRRFSCGTVLKEPDSFAAKLGRSRVPFRSEFAIEHYIPSLIQLYEQVLE